MTDGHKRFLVTASLLVFPLVFVSKTAGVQGVATLLAIVLLYASGRPWLAFGLMSLAELVGYIILPASVRLLPHTHDANLWSVDTLLHVNLQPYAMVAFQHMRVVGLISSVVYNSWAVGIVLAALLGEQAEWFMLRVGIFSCVGALLYPLVPACGPLYYLTSTALAPRNCLPSLHLTWALMNRWQVRGRGLWIRLGADLFLLFTVVAQIGLGQHYVIDLIAAVPFWLVMERAAAVANRRGNAKVLELTRRGGELVGSEHRNQANASRVKTIKNALSLPAIRNWR